MSRKTRRLEREVDPIFDDDGDDLDDDTGEYAHVDDMEDGYRELLTTEMREVALVTRRQLQTLSSDQQWDACLEDISSFGIEAEDEEDIDIHEENTLEVLRLKAKEVGETMSLANEFLFAISEHPGEEEPYSVGMFNISDKLLQTDDIRSRNSNLDLVIGTSLTLIDCPPALIQQITQVLKRRFRENLVVMKKTHPEIRVREGLRITFKEVSDKFDEIARLNPESQSDVAKKYDMAMTKLTTISRIPDNRSNGAVKKLVSEFVRTHERLLEVDKKDKTARLLVLLDAVGAINLSRITITEICLLLEDMTEAEGEVSRFLHEHEGNFARMLGKYFADDIEVDIDEEQFLSDIKNMNIYECLEYAANQKHPLRYRNQAITRANLTSRLYGILTHEHVRAAKNTAAKIREILLQVGERDGNGEPILQEMYYYMDKDGNISMQSSDIHNVRRKAICRKWKAPSGREYNISIVDEENVIKMISSLLLKGILKNSEGDPENLFDIVRFAVVFFDIESQEEFFSEEVRRDIYSFLCEINEKAGCNLAMLDETVNILEDSFIDISRKLKRRSDMRPGKERGRFVLQDKMVDIEKERESRKSGALEKPDEENARSRILDIKSVARLAGTKMGFEILTNCTNVWAAMNSQDTPESHIKYDERKELDGQEITYPACDNPRKWIRIVGIKHEMAREVVNHQLMLADKEYKELRTRQDGTARGGQSTTSTERKQLASLFRKVRALQKKKLELTTTADRLYDMMLQIDGLTR